MQVVADGQAGDPGLAEEVALFHFLADLHVDLAQVGVERLQPQAVVDDDGLAVDAQKPGEDHLAAVGRRHGSAFKGSQVHAHVGLLVDLLVLIEVGAVVAEAGPGGGVWQAQEGFFVPEHDRGAFLGQFF